MLALYTQYFPESCEQNITGNTRVGFEPTTLTIDFTGLGESTEYTVLTHIGVWVKSIIVVISLVVQNVPDFKIQMLAAVNARYVWSVSL